MGIIIFFKEILMDNPIIGSVVFSIFSAVLGLAVGFYFRTLEEKRRYKIQKYEEFMVVIEEVLNRTTGENDQEYFKKLNEANAKLILSASSGVLNAVRENMKGDFNVGEREPIYRAIRNDIYPCERIRRFFRIKYKYEKERFSFFTKGKQNNQE